VAVHISQRNSDKIYVTNPQALLRSVVVLKFSIDASGRLVSRELVRSNKDKETETTALQSLARAQPFPVPPATFLKQGKLELLETWLFNTVGRFQLRTIALPQRGE
jgi:protein TonB